MNFVFLSPHFPPHYYLFCVHLRKYGANVFGLADEHFHLLRNELREVLTDYYKVFDMNSYDELLRALGYFTHRYGKLDRIDSLNEYWLETEARLRTDFNIWGLKISDMPKIKRKSEMKKVFIEAGIPVAKGIVPQSSEQIRNFIDEVGYPIVAKPDIGVGANKTYKINNSDEAEDFIARELKDYILEEFIEGKIQTFDGITNRDGDIVFYSSMEYSKGVMETVNEDADIYYYTLRNIPTDIEKNGRKIVKAFELKERFFHFEFFRTNDNKIIALEVNMRPPGGLTTDMMNYANDIDVYQEWANIIVNNRFDSKFSWDYYCGYIGRKFNKRYVNSHLDIVNTFGNKIVHHTGINDVFSGALGNYGYVLRSKNLDDIASAAEFIQMKY